MILALVLLTLSGSAGAAGLEGELNVGALTDAVPESARELLEGMSPTKPPGNDVLVTLGERLLDHAASLLRPVVHTAGVVLVVCVLVSLANALELGGRAPQYILLSGVCAIGGASMGDLNSFVREGVRSLEEMCDFSKALLPTMVTTATLSGSVSGAAAKYALTTLAMDVLLSLARDVLVPAVAGCAALSLADAAVGNDILKTAKKLLRSLCTTLVTLLAMGFTGWLSLTHLLTAPGDSFGVRAAKTAVSSALPVVGGILAEAAGALSAASGALSSTVGVFGILAVAGVCLVHVLPLGLRYLVYKLSAAVCSCVADKRMGELIGDLGACFGLLLAIDGAGALILSVSIYSLIRAVT